MDFLFRYIYCFLSIGFTGFLFSFSVMKDIKNELKVFDEQAKSKQSMSEIKEKLNKFKEVKFMNPPIK